MTDSDTADQMMAKRARMMPTLAIIFLAQQITYFSGNRLDAGKLRLVSYVSITGWLVMSIVLLVGLTTSNPWVRSPRVRALMNDESTRANRAEGFRFGFLFTMGSAILLYVLSLFEPLDGREAIHVLMSIGIAAALLRFGLLERRALREA